MRVTCRRLPSPFSSAIVIITDQRPFAQSGSSESDCKNVFRQIRFHSWFTTNDGSTSRRFLAITTPLEKNPGEGAMYNGGSPPRSFFMEFIHSNGHFTDFSGIFNDILLLLIFDQ